ncbi:hypothetical protein GGU11DRAFT_741167 [Lentinula aff. detonsa]|nr:hypothetical protein GGU11DRAFT_741167 [Lentinula aff. detonsa]
MSGQRAAPPHGIAVMLLFDNNSFTKIAWSDLHDHYLPSFFEKLSFLHPAASITTFVQECGIDGNMDELSPPAPRKYNDFQDVIQGVHFSAAPTHRLTGPLIHQAIEFLSAIAATDRHIVIIGPSLLQTENSNINWHRLAQSLAKVSIYCHLMLHAHAGSTETLNLMFTETLRLQRLVEDKSWFPDTKSQIVPRMSSIRTLTPPLEVVTPFKVTSPSVPALRQSSLPAPFINNFPKVTNQIMHVPTIPTPASDAELPSIVTQLQQMHGLTKKKVYGKKPKRPPFVSSEVYRDSPRKAASLSPVSPSDTNHGGRVTSPSLIDRTTRVHGSVISHPGIARSSLDIVSNGQVPVHNHAPSYRPPTTTMSLPSSPVSRGPPLYPDSTVVSSRTAYHQPQPLVFMPSPSHLHTVSKSASGFAEDITVKTYSRGDGGVSNFSSAHDDRLYLKQQNQDTSFHATTSYPVSPSVYRDELLSHLGGPMGSTSSDQHFTHAPSSELSSYVQNNQNIDSFTPLRQPALWHAPYDSPSNFPSNQIHTISQYGMITGPSKISSYPPSPVSSSSSSLTGWAG